MSDLILPRRKFVIGLASPIAAPAIVRASSLMPVKTQRFVVVPWGPANFIVYDGQEAIRQIIGSMYLDLFKDIKWIARPTS